MIPKGSWIDTANYYKIIDNTLNVEIQKEDGTYVIDNINIEPYTSYHNNNGKLVPQKYKYFNEMPNNSHLDIRYGKENLTKEEIQNTLYFLKNL